MYAYAWMYEYQYVRGGEKWKRSTNNKNFECIQMHWIAECVLRTDETRAIPTHTSTMSHKWKTRPRERKPAWYDVWTIHLQRRNKSIGNDAMPMWNLCAQEQRIVAIGITKRKPNRLSFCDRIHTTAGRLNVLFSRIPNVRSEHAKKKMLLVLFAPAQSTSERQTKNL